jgi:two-component sensor histidine kinase
MVGKVVGAYYSDGADWTLSVSGDGIGMLKDTASAKPGLGTSIVLALANQLGAKADVADARLGTRASIPHSEHATNFAKREAPLAV